MTSLRAIIFEQPRRPPPQQWKLVKFPTCALHLSFYVLGNGAVSTMGPRPGPTCTRPLCVGMFQEPNGF